MNARFELPDDAIPERGPVSAARRAAKSPPKVEYSIRPFTPFRFFEAYRTQSPPLTHIPAQVAPPLRADQIKGSQFATEVRCAPHRTVPMPSPHHSRASVPNSRRLRRRPQGTARTSNRQILKDRLAAQRSQRRHGVEDAAFSIEQASSNNGRGAFILELECHTFIVSSVCTI